MMTVNLINTFNKCVSNPLDLSNSIHSGLITSPLKSVLFDKDNTVSRKVNSHAPLGEDNRVPTIACHNNTILSEVYEALLPSNVSVPQSRQTWVVSPHLQLPPVQSTDRGVVVPEYPPNPTAVRTNIPMSRMMVITALHDRVATISASIIPQFVSVSPPVSLTAVTSSPLSRRFFDIVPRFEFTGRFCRVWRSPQKPGLFI
jgi:hypothetical protein